MWGKWVIRGLARRAASHRAVALTLLPLLVIPAEAGLRRQDAGANIRVANGPKGNLRTQIVIQLFGLVVDVSLMIAL